MGKLYKDNEIRCRSEVKERSRFSAQAYTRAGRNDAVTTEMGQLVKILLDSFYCSINVYKCRDFKVATRVVVNYSY